MIAFIATIHKELILLLRDRVGLTVLFLMPAALVVVMSVVQDSAWKAMQETELEVLLVNNDGGALGSAIEAGLIETGYLKVTSAIDGKELTEERAREAVSKGLYRASIVIPQGSTSKAEERAEAIVKESSSKPSFSLLSAPGDARVDIKSPRGNDGSADKGVVLVYFDPAIRSSYKSAVTSALRGIISAAEIKIFIEALADNFPMAFNNKRGSIKFESLVKLDEIIAMGEGAYVVPTSVQQNVPAWTMFAMFFVVIPLSGSLIRETSEGTLNRLRTMPITYLSVIMGKIIIYVMVCLSQFALMLLIGMHLLPLLGLPALEIVASHLPAALVALASALAATGFGILFGTVFETQDQAANFGAVMVVIAAAIGGIMVPVFVMPDFMQMLSVVSPLGWGLNAFLNIFVRGGSLSDVLTEIISLAGFFALTVGISLIVFHKRYNQ